MDAKIPGLNGHVKDKESYFFLIPIANIHMLFKKKKRYKLFIYETKSKSIDINYYKNLSFYLTNISMAYIILYEHIFD